LGIITEYRLEEKYNHNILSVIFDSDSFFYGISDVNNQLKLASKFRLEGNAVDEISSIIQNENLSDHYYSAVNIYSKLPNFSFIPANEYQYGMERDIISNAFPLENEEIGMEICSEDNLHIIHSYSQLYIKAFEPLTKDAQFRHLSLAYIQNIREDGVFVNVLDGELIIMVRKNTNFTFYNQFNTPTNDDQLYFVMLTYHQLSLDPLKDHLYLHGDKIQVEEFKVMVSDYVANVEDSTLGFLNVEGGSDIIDLYLASICE